MASIDLPAPIESSLDPPTHSKLTSLHSDYEALLELQLEDQRLYYEKVAIVVVVQAAVVVSVFLFNIDASS